MKLLQSEVLESSIPTPRLGNMTASSVPFKLHLIDAGKGATVIEFAGRIALLAQKICALL